MILVIFNMDEDEQHIENCLFCKQQLVEIEIMLNEGFNQDDIFKWLDLQEKCPDLLES